MPKNKLATCTTDELNAVIGGASMIERAQKSVFGEPRAIQQFVGGVGGGLLLGVNAKNHNMDKFISGRTPAAKAGFGLGAMGNMALGPAGKLLSLSNKTPAP